MAEKKARPKPAEAGAKSKGQAKRATKRKAAAEEPAARDRMVDAAMALAAERGWRDLSLRDIAEASGLSLADAYRACPSKLAILEAFMRRIDAIVLSEEAIAPDDETARDRIFDVMMRRFDALEPYKQALGAILLDLAGDPLAALASLPSFKRSMSWMLEAAGLETEGLKGLARIEGISLIYLASLRVWLRDESPDQAKTMAALDGYLRRVEGVVRRFDRGGSPRD